MFTSSFEQIKKKITKSKFRKQGYKILERKIFESPILKSQFGLFVFLKENEGKIKAKDLANFVTKLNETKKYSKEEIKKEVVGLLEYFNIHPKSIKISEMDKAVNLEEKAIRRIVGDNSKSLIKQTYKNIVLNEDDDSLRKQFRIIKFLTESTTDKRKKFINESLNSLIEARYVNYSKCVSNLYKLRMLTEDKFDDGEEQTKSKYGGAKKVSFSDLTYLKRIEVVTPEKFLKPEKVIITFRLDVFPIGATQMAVRTSNLRTKQSLNRLERVFVNSTIYNKNRTNLFNPVGTIWDVMLNEQPKVGETSTGRISIYLNTSAEHENVNTWEDLSKAAYQMLKEFDAVLPELLGDNAKVLTKTAQIESIKIAKGLSTKERKRQDNFNGLVDRNLIKNKILKKQNDEFETRVDDFSGAF